MSPTLRTVRTRSLAVIAIALVAVGAFTARAYYGASAASASANTVDAQRSLGQRLFNDVHLSADGSVSCASCHQPSKQFSDDRPVSIGTGGLHGTRNAPSLLALGSSDEGAFFWDGRRADLKQAVMDPFTNPVEMGLPGKTVLQDRLRGDVHYQTAFAIAFPDHGTAITDAEISAALAAYVRSLNTETSPYDRYAGGHDAQALSPLAQLGLGLFKGKADCVACHRLEGSPAPLTDHGYHRTGVGMESIATELPVLTQGVIDRSLKGYAVGDRVATHANEAQLGRFNVTLNPADIGMFRTPSLRHVAQTAPYMHDGSVPTLEEAIDREIYYRGLQNGRPLNLSVEERRALAAFLQSL